MSDLYAILTTNHGCPKPDTRFLIAMPTATTNPHAVGRIVTAVSHGEFVTGGRTLPRFLLTVSIESTDDAAAKREFSDHIALDCYQTRAEVERWHAVDDGSIDYRGYGQNHWL